MSKKLAIYNENAFIVLSDKTMCLCDYDKVKAWLYEDEIETPPLNILDKYREIKCIKNYNKLQRALNLLDKNVIEFIFTEDGRDNTLLISDLKFVDYV
jgi:hypothetical protein